MVCYCKIYMLHDLLEYIYPIIPLMPVSVKVPLLIRSFHSPKSVTFGCEKIIQVLCSERALCAVHDLLTAFSLYVHNVLGHLPIILKSLKMPNPIDLKQSFRNVLDCSH